MSIFPSAPPPAPEHLDDPGAVSRAPLLALVAAMFVALAAVFASGCSRGSEGEARAAEPPPPAGTVALTPAQMTFVTVESVGVRAERTVATLPAQIGYDEDHTARVLSPVTGRVVQLDAKIGDAVAKGAPLAHLLSSDVAQAEADVAKAGAAAQQTSTALSRARDLYAHGVIAQKDLQQAEADAAAARAEQERAGLRTRLLGAGTGSTVSGQTFVLRTPVAGEVLDRQVNPGTEVQPGAGNPLFVVSDLGDVWLTASLYQRDLAAVRRGMRVRFVSDGLPDHTPVVATIGYVSDALDPTTRTATMRAVVPNPGHRIRTAVFGQATVFSADSTQTPVVPSAALVTRGTGSVVYVEDSPGRFRRRAVTVGADDGTTATITSGLKSGERVVTRGSLLVDGEAAQAVNGSAQPAATQPGVSVGGPNGRR